MGVIEKEQVILRLVEQNKREVVKFLQKLLSFDSQIIDQGIKGKEGRIQKWLAKELKNLDCQVDIFEPDNRALVKYADFNPGHNYQGRPNVVGVFKGSGGGRSLILNGHIDTVSPGNTALWRHNPYAGDIEGDRLIGLGAVDMKGGLAAMLTAMRIIKQADVRLRGDVIFQSVVDEEGGGNGTLACVDHGYCADAAIIAEPTGFEICCAHRGAMHARINVKGLSTHACLKSKGVNAIEKMLMLTGALDGLDKQWQANKRHSLLPSPAITCCQISGGTGASIIPAECEAKINVKYLPSERAQDVRKEVEDCISRVAQGDDWLRQNPPLVIWLLNTPPYETSVNHPLIEVLKETLTDMKREAKISGLPSGADARILNNIGKIPSFIMGPGDLVQAHHIDEALSVPEYLQAIKVFVLSICRWTK